MHLPAACALSPPRCLRPLSSSILRPTPSSHQPQQQLSPYGAPPPQMMAQGPPQEQMMPQQAPQYGAPPQVYGEPPAEYEYYSVPLLPARCCVSGHQPESS